MVDITKYLFQVSFPVISGTEMMAFLINTRKIVAVSKIRQQHLTYKEIY